MAVNPCVLALGAALAAAIVAGPSEAIDGPAPILSVSAGRFDRLDTPVRLDLGPDQAPEPVLRAADKSGLLLARELRDDEPTGDPLPIQVERIGDGPEAPIRLSMILAGPTPSGSSRRFEIIGMPESWLAPTSWAFRETADGHLELSIDDAPVFRYTMRPVSDPDHPNQNQPRDAYIHPAYAPSGAVITGDYSKESHPHHRGFFLAYTKTEVGDLHPDFWNIQNGSGKVRFDRLGAVHAGPVTARFTADHRWEAARPDADPVVVLRETWEVEAIDVPGVPYRQIDLTSTQRANESPMVLPPYRYGGMAYRGPDSFFPKGVLDVLTSEGLDRVRGDQKPARWVDLTGPVADGSDTYAGAAILDHPTNLHHPTPARIHPATLPFFCFVPSHDATVTIGVDAPIVFRYRILIHDGHPDAGLDERLWRDFAEPPTATLSKIKD